MDDDEYYQQNDSDLKRIKHPLIFSIIFSFGLVVLFIGLLVLICILLNTVDKDVVLVAFAIVSMASVLTLTTYLIIQEEDLL